MCTSCISEGDLSVNIKKCHMGVVLSTVSVGTCTTPYTSSGEEALLSSVELFSCFTGEGCKQATRPPAGIQHHHTHSIKSRSP